MISLLTVAIDLNTIPPSEKAPVAAGAPRESVRLSTTVSSMEVFVSSAGSAYAARKERLNRHARIGMTNREPDGAVGFSANY